MICRPAHGNFKTIARKCIENLDSLVEIDQVDGLPCGNCSAAIGNTAHVSPERLTSTGNGKGRNRQHCIANAKRYPLFANGYSLLANGYSLLANGYPLLADGYSALVSGYLAATNEYSAVDNGYSAVANGYFAATTSSPGTQGGEKKDGRWEMRDSR